MQARHLLLRNQRGLNEIGLSSNALFEAMYDVGHECCFELGVSARILMRTTSAIKRSERRRNVH